MDSCFKLGCIRLSTNALQPLLSRSKLAQAKSKIGQNTSLFLKLSWRYIAGLAGGITHHSKMPEVEGPSNNKTSNPLSFQFSRKGKKKKSLWVVAQSIASNNATTPAQSRLCILFLLLRDLRNHVPVSVVVWELSIQRVALDQISRRTDSQVNARGYVAGTISARLYP